MLRIAIISILAPFPDIPMHVVKAPGVGGVTAYRAGFSQVRPFFCGAVGEVAIAVRLCTVKLLPKMIRRAGASPTAIFPFGFGR